MDYSESIKQAIADYFNMNVDLLKEKTRKREVVIVRQTAMAIIKEVTDLSLKSVGLMFGRDHSTVIHALVAVQNMIDTDRNYAVKIAELKEKIYREVNMDVSQEIKEDQIDREFIHLL